MEVEDLIKGRTDEIEGKCLAGDSSTVTGGDTTTTNNSNVSDSTTANSNTNVATTVSNVDTEAGIQNTSQTNNVGN